jgi:hypothetical protein
MNKHKAVAVDFEACERALIGNTSKPTPLGPHHVAASLLASSSSILMTQHDFLSDSRSSDEQKNKNNISLHAVEDIIK